MAAFLTIGKNLAKSQGILFVAVLVPENDTFSLCSKIHKFDINVQTELMA